MKTTDENGRRHDRRGLFGSILQDCGNRFELIFEKQIKSMEKPACLGKRQY